MAVNKTLSLDDENYQKLMKLEGNKSGLVNELLTQYFNKDSLTYIESLKKEVEKVTNELEVLNLRREQLIQQVNKIWEDTKEQEEEKIKKENFKYLKVKGEDIRTDYQLGKITTDEYWKVMDLLSEERRKLENDDGK